jgi:hypothetical protein
MIVIKIITLILIIYIINYIVNKKKEILLKNKQKLVNLINSGNTKRIFEHKDILDIIYSIEGYYYYNQRAYIEMINYIEDFLEIIDLIKIDNHIATNFIDNLLDLKTCILNCLLSFELILPYEYNVKDVLTDLNNVLEKYISEVYLIHEKYIKQNGMEHTIKLYTKSIKNGYNIDVNIFEPKTKLLFNRI